MTEHCIIRADFSNWRPIQGRKVMQLIFELPIEDAESALRMLGIPQPGESKWCAIALLENGKPANERSAGSQKQMPRPSENGGAVTSQTGNEPSPINANTAETGTSETATLPSSEPKANGSSKKFHELPLSQQAAIRCGDKSFQEYVQMPNDMEASAEVRKVCYVGSRAELDRPENQESRALWLKLEENYQSWLTDRKFAEAKR